MIALCLGCSSSLFLAYTTRSPLRGRFWGKLRSRAERTDREIGLFQASPWVAGPWPASGPVVLSGLQDISWGSLMGK